MKIDLDSGYLQSKDLWLPRYHLGSFFPINPRSQAREAAIRMNNADKSEIYVWGERMKETFPIFTRRVVERSGRSALKTFKVNPNKTPLESYKDLKDFLLAFAEDYVLFGEYKNSCLVGSMPDMLDNLATNGMGFWMRGYK